MRFIVDQLPSLVRSLQEAWLLTGQSATLLVSLLTVDEIL